MSKAQRSEEIASTGMGLVNGIILHHIATCIPKAVALNGKEMQLAMDKSSLRLYKYLHEPTYQSKLLITLRW